MRKLYIYTGITPNQDNGKHYMFNSVILYMQALQQHLLMTVDLDNYRINSNVAKLDLKSPLTAENFDTVTYLIDYDSDTNYFRAYTVIRADLGAYVVYSLSVDLWATFIKDCDFSKVHVTRCNRQLSQYGIYDEPQSTEQDFATEPVKSTNAAWLVDGYSDALAKSDSVYIVYLLQYNVKQNIFGSNEAVTKTALFATPLSEFESVLVDGTTLLELATDLIGCIYGVTGTLGALDAQVLEAYILPAPLLTVSNTYITAKSKLWGSDADVKAFYVKPSATKKLDFTMLPTDPNYIYYFGTINNGIKLKKYTKNTDRVYASIRSFVGATTLKIVASQGESQKDITNDFAITLTTSASVTTAIRQFAKTFSESLSIGQQVSKQVGKGDFAGAGLTGVGGFVEQLNTPIMLNKVIGNGDASTIYYIANPPVPAVLNPFVITKFLSVNDANKHTRMYGATFDYFASNGNAVTVFDFDSTTLLGSGDITDTYIIASCDIDGVPLEAHNEIGRKLSAGIYYTLLK